jgi:DNA-binding NtrC family response regulator
MDSELKVEAKPGVLIVDDDPLVRSALRRILRGLPVESYEAKTAEEALAWLEGRPELAAVVTDFEMGDGANDLDLFERIRARFPSAMAILHTAAISVTVTPWAGAVVTIVAKPCEPDLLRKLVARAVSA